VGGWVDDISCQESSSPSSAPSPSFAASMKAAAAAAQTTVDFDLLLSKIL